MGVHLKGGGWAHELVQEGEEELGSCEVRLKRPRTAMGSKFHAMIERTNISLPPFSATPKFIVKTNPTDKPENLGVRRGFVRAYVWNKYPGCHQSEVCGGKIF